MKNSLIIIFIIGFLFSCKKEDESVIDYPVSLYTSEISHVSDIRMFVGGNETKDCEKILEFIKNTNCFNLPNVLDMSSEPIIFHTNDSVVFGTNNLNSFNVQKNGKQILFYSTYPVYVYENDIVRPLLKYTDELGLQVLIPSFPWGFVIAHRTKEIRVGYGAIYNLEMCFFAYKISKNTNYSKQLAWGTQSNEFNDEMLNSLQVTDTVAIQEYRIRFVTK